MRGTARAALDKENALMQAITGSQNRVEMDEAVSIAWTTILGVSHNVALIHVTLNQQVVTDSRLPRYPSSAALQGNVGWCCYLVPAHRLAATS